MKESDIVRGLFDNLDLMAWAIDPSGKILVSEGAALRNLGVEPGQTVGYNAFELYGNPDSIANMHRALAGERLAVVDSAHATAEDVSVFLKERSLAAARSAGAITSWSTVVPLGITVNEARLRP